MGTLALRSDRRKAALAWSAGEPIAMRCRAIRRSDDRRYRSSSSWEWLHGERQGSDGAPTQSGGIPSLVGGDGRRTISVLRKGRGKGGPRSSGADAALTCGLDLQLVGPDVAEVDGPVTGPVALGND